MRETSGMKILVLGAAGKTGEAVVRRGVERGHTVTAFVHDMGNFEAQANVQVMEGDALDASAIRVAVASQEVVIDALGGHTPWKQTSLETNAARNVIEAMEAQGAKRLIVVSAIGVGDTRDLVPGWYEHLIMPTLLRGVMQDKAAMEPVIGASGLNWTLVRPGHLVDGEAKGGVDVLPDHAENPGHEITREDLARFLVQIAETGEYSSEAVNVVSRRQ